MFTFVKTNRDMNYEKTLDELGFEPSEYIRDKIVEMYAQWRMTGAHSLKEQLYKAVDALITEHTDFFSPTLFVGRQELELHLFHDIYLFIDVHVITFWNGYEPGHKFLDTEINIRGWGLTINEHITIDDIPETVHIVHDDSIKASMSIWGTCDLMASEMDIEL